MSKFIFFALHYLFYLVWVIQEVRRPLSGGEHLDDVAVGCHKGNPQALRGLFFQIFLPSKDEEREGVWQEIHSQSENKFQSSAY